MFSWLNKLRRRGPAVIGFGKVPAWPEFMRCGARDDAAGELESWLGKAAEFGATHRSEAWKGMGEQPPLRFVLRSIHGEAVLTGVVVPSTDSVGRQFPLTLAAVVPVRDAGAWAHAAPLAFSGFLDRASRALPRALTVSSPKELEELLADLQPPDLEDLQRHAQEYEDWASRETLGALLERLIGPASEATLHTILEATSPFRGHEAPPTALSVRLPLSDPEDLTLCFWLHVIRRACGWKDTVPGYFALPGSALVQLGGTASPSALADSWVPDHRSKFVCSEDADTSKYASALPESVKELLGSEGATVGELVERMGG